VIEANLKFESGEDQHQELDASISGTVGFVSKFIEGFEKDLRDNVHPGTIEELMERHSFNFVPFMWYLWTGFGYGANVPAVYLYRYVKVVGVTMGRLGTFSIKGGNDAIWKKCAMELERLGVRVTTDCPLKSVSINADGKKYLEFNSTKQDTVECDFLINAVNPAVAQDILPDDFCPVLRKWDTIPYCYTLFKCPSIKDQLKLKHEMADTEFGVAIIPAHNADMTGRVLVIQKVGIVGNFYAAYQYAVDVNSESWREQKELSPLELQQYLEDYLASRFNVKEGFEIIDQKRWDYFPFLKIESLVDPSGLTESELELQKQQGKDGIFFAGAWKQFEIVECAVRDAKQLVKDFF